MTTSRKLVWIFAIAAVAISIFAPPVIYPYEAHHFFFSPPSINGSRDFLRLAEVIRVDGALGPESIAFDPIGGGPYTGVADGRILKWQSGSIGWTEFAFTSPNRQNCSRPFAPGMEHVCGRPLGLRFDKKTGDMYIADAYFGLLLVGPEGGLATQLATEAEGEPFRFTNDMDIDEQDDVIYFTDSSAVFQRRQFIFAFLSGDKTGRLMKYDISSKKVTVLLKGLSFANGVALSKDNSFVLIAETSAARIIRYWLRGPKAGKFDIFADKLPGSPDNVRRNPKGEFWVALHSKTGIISKLALSHPWIGKTFLKLPLSFPQLHSLMVGGKPHATGVKLSEIGEIVEVIEDCEGKTLKFISEVEEKDGKLWFGSVMMPFIGIYNL